jgi:hypothetical protein
MWAAVMGLTWAFFWVPAGAAAASVIVGELDPPHIGGPLYLGFVCGAMFSALAGLASGRRKLEAVPLTEAAIVGAAAGCFTGILPFVLGEGHTTNYESAWSTLAVVVSMTAAWLAARRRWLGTVRPPHAAVAAGLLAGLATAVVPWVVTSDDEFWVRWAPVWLGAGLAFLSGLSACASVLVVRWDRHQNALAQSARS